MLSVNTIVWSANDVVDMLTKKGMLSDDSFVAPILYWVMYFLFISVGDVKYNSTISLFLSFLHFSHMQCE